MRLENMTIATQLRFGLGAILALVALLGGMAWFQSDRLWQETQGLYEHPLQVRRALGEIRVDILTMSLGMRDLLRADDVEERQRILQTIDGSEAAAYQNFDILRDRYLGPKSDIDLAHTAFVQWETVRSEAVRLLESGRTDEAEKRIRPGGAVAVKSGEVLTRLQRISDFAAARGDRFYRTARSQRDALMAGLWVLLGAILLVTAGISYLLLKGIRRPLEELTSVTGEYRRGDLDARSSYQSANEFGTLAASFNQLADTVQTELRIRESAARIDAVMLAEDDLRPFCRELLSALTEHTGSQVGAIYLLNREKTVFEHFESLGLGQSGRGSFSATSREGEFGSALATGRIQRIADIPADTRFAFAAVSGDFLPREVLTIPILSGGEAVAMLSLASVRSYPAPAIRLLDDLLGTLTARLNGVLAYRQIREFSERLEFQNRELEEQKKELTVQADELCEQNMELELQKKQLDEANRLKSAFLSNMSHELRTPLNSVIALAGVLSRRLRDTVPAEEYSYLEVIERNGRQLLDLINDILDLSRIEAGREEISLDSFTARELITGVAEMVEHQARDKGVRLLVQVDPELPEIRSDVSKWRHILQNIVGNAVKFTEQGRVELTAVRDGETIRMTVADTGIGIAADQIPHIFDEFRQADGSTSRKYGGTGLGLAIAKKYADLLNGRIEVESTPGRGSTFTVTLPLAEDASSGDARAADAADSPPAAGPALPVSRQADTGARILLVEDSEPAVIQITDILTRQGYRVAVARDGREALDRIESSTPDAMILDLMMPEVDGFQVIHQVRARERTALLPVLILTAKHVTREELQFLKGNHIHQLIQKGDIRKAELLAAVERLVAQSPGTEAPPGREPTERGRAERPLVLVVEDNPDNMKTVRALLADTCTLVEAGDGRTGIELARSRRPDLILMDISLPEVDGFAAFEEIRCQETLRSVPVIALTARAMAGDREEMLARGFDGYLSKPIDAELLHQAVREALDGN